MHVSLVNTKDVHSPMIQMSGKNISRCVLILVICCAVCNLEYIDSKIFYVWHNILSPSIIFQHDSYEVTMSSILFVIFIFSFLILDYYVPAAHIFRIKNSSSSNQTWKGRSSALFEETLWYTLPWYMLDMLYPRRHLLLAQFPEAPTCLQIVQEVCFSLAVYDFLFFCGHLSMHKNPFLFKTVHSKHHATGGLLRAGDAVRHSFLDGTYDVLCSVAALKITNAHPFSRSIYNACAIFLLTENHSSYDFPWSSHNLMPFFAGPVVHRRHHQKGSSNYAKFFTWLDYFWGSLEVPDLNDTSDKKIH